MTRSLNGVLAPPATATALRGGRCLTIACMQSGRAWRIDARALRYDIMVRKEFQLSFVYPRKRSQTAQMKARPHGLLMEWSLVSWLMQVSSLLGCSAIGPAWHSN